MLAFEWDKLGFILLSIAHNSSDICKSLIESIYNLIKFCGIFSFFNISLISAILKKLVFNSLKLVFDSS